MNIYLSSFNWAAIIVSIIVNAIWLLMFVKRKYIQKFNHAKEPVWGWHDINLFSELVLPIDIVIAVGGAMILVLSFF